MIQTSDDDQAALRLAASRGAALCTIVGIDGSFSRRLGAQLAIAADGTMAGSLADGCLERELATQAGLAANGGLPRVLRYGRGSPFIDFRLPCGSGLDVLIEPSPEQSAMASVVAALDARSPASLALPVDRTRLLRQRAYLPLMRLLALGGGSEASEFAWLAEGYGAPLQSAGPGNGLHIGRRPDLAVDPWTAIVLLFHDHEWEAEVLDWAMGSPAFYIGALGGSVARRDRRAWLEAKGYSAPDMARVRSPIGLIPQARDARVVALSVLAEVVAAYEGLRS